MKYFYAMAFAVCLSVTAYAAAVGIEPAVWCVVLSLGLASGCAFLDELAKEEKE